MAAKRETRAVAKRGGAKNVTPAQKRTTERVKAKAKAAGATGSGNRLSRHQRALRATAILAAKHAGESTRQIAAEWGITQRAVQIQLEQMAESSSPLDQRPMALLEDLARMYRRQIVDFARTAAENADRNPSVSLGAMKGGADALERYANLLADIGKLPDNLEVFRTEMEQRRFGDLMLVKIKQVEEGEITLADLSAFFERMIEPATPLFDVEGEARELEPGDEEAA